VNRFVQPSALVMWLLCWGLAPGPARAVELDNLPELLADTGARDVTPAQTPPQLFGLLGGVAVNTGRYAGSDDRVTVPMPLVYFNYNDRLYWSIASVGGWLWRSDDRSFRLGLLAKSRGRVDGDDAPYDGITDRDASIDAGLNIAWRVTPLVVGVSWLGDALGRSHGQTASLRLSLPIRLDERWSTSPSLVADWMDDKLVDYYYGVTAAETAGGAPLYAGNESLNLRAGWSVTYRLSRAWSLLGGVSYTRLGDGMADSPLVTRSDNLLVYAGAAWNFLHRH